MISVHVNGSKGNVGKEIVKVVQNDQELTLAGQTDLGDNLSDALAQNKPDIVIDFTSPSSAYANTETILAHGCNAIVGTTGITPQQRSDLNKLALKNNVGVLIAPNFCIGAVLMLTFAAEAAKYMPHVEIIEYHHDKKADAPSGTAIATAEYINAVAGGTKSPAVQSKEILDEHSQGAHLGNIRIHAVRLPGFVASQEVILGGMGQTLKIRHDTINREAFMPGILFAVKNIQGKTGMFYGLETLLLAEQNR